MDSRHSPKTNDRPYFKILMVPFVALLVFLAVMAGIQAGDLLYRLNVNIVGKIDPEAFRNTIRLSLPIIENVYNNGKSSASFTGEIKDLFSKAFGFDLDSPVTILNVQSPMFMSYYNHAYKPPQANTENGQHSEPAQMPGAGGNAGTEGNKPEEGLIAEAGEEGKGGQGQADGSGGSGGTDGGGKGGNADGIGAGTSGNTDGKDGSTGGENGNSGANGSGGSANNTGGSTEKAGGSSGSNPGASGSSNKNGTGGGAPLTTQNDGPLDLQPISSITYEVEDEEEDKDSDTVELDKMVVKNFTKHKIDIVALLKEPLKLKFDKKGPKVLIYHTHTSESYVLKEQDLGKKNVPSYNTNPKYSVVRVGEELSRHLKKYGIETLHNGTVHDKVRNAAYGVAIETLQSYKKSYPSIKVFIDIHRDGLDASQPKLRLTKKINGKNAAQVMFVVGTDDMLPHPQWEENLKFVLRVQQKLNEKYPGLARPVWIVGKRYNQQISNQAVLIEIGADGNLLSECLESTKYVAEALNEVMKGK